MLMLRHLIDKKRRNGTILTNTTMETTTTTMEKEEEAESSAWNDLNPLILERIREFLDSDLHDLRLRSVCRHWRASLSYPRRINTQIRFPIELPPFSDLGPENMMLSCSIVYRISPAEDPSHGWLIKSQNTKPNTFTLVDPFSNCRVNCRPNSIHTSIDLLQFHVSEFGKCYRIKRPFYFSITKVLLLLNFAVNVDFTVLALVEDEIHYWNNGDSAWTKVNTPQNYRFQDMIQFKGAQYALTDTGCLVSFDSEFRFQGVIPPLDHGEYHLATYKTDLFLLSETKGTPQDLLVYKMVSGSWIRVENLGDIILLSRFDGEGLSVQDFKTCKGNRVYLVEDHMLPYRSWNRLNIMSGSYGHVNYRLYDLDESRTVRSIRDKFELGSMFWPPPIWMCPYYMLVYSYRSSINRF